MADDGHSDNVSVTSDFDMNDQAGINDDMDRPPSSVDSDTPTNGKFFT